MVSTLQSGTTGLEEVAAWKRGSEGCGKTPSRFMFENFICQLLLFSTEVNDMIDTQ